MVKTERAMRRWVEGHVNLTLDQLSQEDAEFWHQLAVDETWRFFREGEYALRLKRRRMQEPPPRSRKEVVAFLLEFRCKLQLVHDRFDGIPCVPLFDFGGEALFASGAFRQFTLFYGNMGGAA